MELINERLISPQTTCRTGKACETDEVSSSGNVGTRMTEKTAVWDSVTRIWHWLMVLAIPAMWWTAENDYLSLHILIGTALVGFLVFRLLWGLWGSSTARFGHFIKGPKALLSYARNLNRMPYKPHFGHNPLGGLSVVAILLALVAQIGTGLFAEDTDGLYSGPLSRYVSYETAHAAAELHETLFNITLALIGLHLLAIAFYTFVKKTNLVRPMITGKADMSAVENEKAGLKKPGFLRLIITFALAGGIVAWLML